MKIAFEHKYNEKTKKVDFTATVALPVQEALAVDTERIISLAGHISDTINDIEGPGVNCSGILEVMENLLDEITVESESDDTNNFEGDL